MQTLFSPMDSLHHYLYFVNWHEITAGRPHSWSQSLVVRVPSRTAAEFIPGLHWMHRVNTPTSITLASNIVGLTHPVPVHINNFATTADWSESWTFSNGSQDRQGTVWWGLREHGRISDQTYTLGMWLVGASDSGAWGPMGTGTGPDLALHNVQRTRTFTFSP